MDIEAEKQQSADRISTEQWGKLIYSDGFWLKSMKTQVYGNQAKKKKKEFCLNALVENTFSNALQGLYT